MDQGDAAQGDVPRRIEDRLDRLKKMPATRVAGISGDRRGSTRRFSNEHRTSAARCRQSLWPIRVITGPQPRVVVDHRASLPHSTLACAAMAAQPPHPQIRIAERSRSEEHTSELQSLAYLVCRLLLEKKKPFIPEAASCLIQPRHMVVPFA